MPNRLDLTGQKYGRLSVVSRAANLGRDVAWNCVCDCGETLVVRAGGLRTGNTRSCGCLKITHGHARGGTRSPTNSTWIAMRQRCYNPNHDCYHMYGGRGIEVCERWQGSFENFLEDMGERPEGMTLDRINNDGDYSPDNCRWATPKQQSRSIRGEKHYNAKITRKDVREIRSASKAGVGTVELAAQYGVHRTTIRRIVRRVSWGHV